MDYVIKVYKDWKFHSQFTEIVPDMDDEMFFNEKHSIRESSKALKKYGSTHTCNHVRNNEILIRHEIIKTDTLQGISLKYGCTTEQIRRANRLFASDSLFLRQYLLIPVDKTSPYYPRDEQRPYSLPARANSVETNGTEVYKASLTDNLLSPTFGDNKLLTKNNNLYSTTIKTSTSDSNNDSHNKSIEVVLSPEEENKKSIDDFLGKIDSTIAESKKYVAKSQHSDDDFLSPTGYEDKHQQYYQQQSSSSGSNSCSSSSTTHHMRHSSSGSSSDTAYLLNLNQGSKRVQNSLQRLEKQQDEFFEL